MKKEKNQRLIDARISKGLTQQDIASKVNVSLRGYQKYEDGQSIPSVRTAIQICDVLGVQDPRELWGKSSAAV